MKQGFLHSSRYSPGNMDYESLEALFVGRGDVMEDVLSRVFKSIQSADKHYILLVGPRGSGKTHFLALAYHRLMNTVDTENIGNSVAVALLNEEEWGVASLLDLLVRILRALSDQAPNLDAEIAEIYERFSKDPADAESFAVAQLRQHTRGKTLLLLCENLVDLFAGLGEEGQKRWRATIQEDGNWAIVASTPSLFAGLTRQDNPFYGFFTIRALQKIDLETGLQLLAKKAVHEGKTELAGFLRTPLGRARARAIHHLAAGNHRAYVVLFDFLDKESLEDLVVPFMRMIDDLTPYYQGRMRQLAPAQRKIVEFLCLAGKPTTIKDISTPCLMSQQTAAKQIGELEAAGFVSRMRHGRNTFCELSEPLMRICIEVRDNKTQRFRLFVELLRHWFTARELESRHRVFQHDDLAAVPDANAVFDADPGHWDSYEESDEGAPDAASETATRPGALRDGALMKRLLAAQARAATERLPAALKGLGAVVPRQEFESNELLHLEATAEILSVSVRNFGPRYLTEGMSKLRVLFADLLDNGVLGDMLTEFLIRNVNRGLAGSLEDWESAFDGLALSLANLPDCQIPVEMLQAAVRHEKTGDEKHLLSLPLEQRQLLEDLLPSAAHERD